MRKGGKREFGQRKKGSVLQYRAPVTRRASGESAPHLRGRQFFLRVRDNAAALFHLGCRHCPTCVGLGVVLGVSPVHLTPHRKTGLYLFARRRWLWCVPWLLVTSHAARGFIPTNASNCLCVCATLRAVCHTPCPSSHSFKSLLVWDEEKTLVSRQKGSIRDASWQILRKKEELGEE